MGSAAVKMRGLCHSLPPFFSCFPGTVPKPHSSPSSFASGGSEDPIGPPAVWAQIHRNTPCWEGVQLSPQFSLWFHRLPRLLPGCWGHVGPRILCSVAWQSRLARGLVCWTLTRAPASACHRDGPVAIGVMKWTPCSAPGLGPEIHTGTGGSPPRAWPPSQAAPRGFCPLGRRAAP